MCASASCSVISGGCEDVRAGPESQKQITLRKADHESQREHCGCNLMAAYVRPIHLVGCCATTLQPLRSVDPMLQT